MIHLRYLKTSTQKTARNATTSIESSDIPTAAMDLLHAFLFLYYFINFLCSAVPRFVTVGCCFVLLICRLLRVVIWLMVREIRMVFAEIQDALGQDDQAVTSLREHCRQMHLVYQDLKMAGAASQGKHQSSHGSLLRSTGRCLLMCILR